MTREIGERFTVFINDRYYLFEVCEEPIPRGGSPECTGCYFKHLHTDVIDNGVTKIVYESLDCWKFKLNSNAGECWSAFRTDGMQAVFKIVKDE